ncbi:MAG: MarR family transcriptional regulator [Deltaproteobacteria bacterium]|nr:MarR family transcriptional regulator [Deltaproteobacteria bacterium]MBW2142409.1 MarR family transcriptional regulator [Deltaproteobacteria bacterium]MBW2324097.1 MarR family transcriptional regulator [Deltaproteobacteria bacterium]
MNVTDAKQELTHSIADNVLIALRKIIQSIDLNSRSLVKRVGLTGPQLVILQEVASTGEVSVGKVAKAISLSQGTVTDIVERMEKRGLVTRRRSDYDRRLVLVHVTESGKQLLEKATPLMEESFVWKFNRLQDWEQAMILSSLQRLVSIMDTKAIKDESILTTGFIEESTVKPETNK